MAKAKKLILVCCMFFAASIVQASLSAETLNDEGTPVLIKKKVHNSGTGKDDPCITAYINGHTLTMNFAQNIGSVLVEISDGQSFMVVTPDTATAYITNSGSYTVTFTLSNGDEYYGNFVVS
jgi:hypothetical protein